VPFGLAADENLDRTWPVPARVFRRWNLSHAAFIAVRTPSSAAVLQRLGSRVPAHLIPHHVPPWQAPEPLAHDEFVIGYAGRLVPEKGLDVLLEAAAGLDGVVVRIVGNGPLRRDLELRASDHRVTLEIDSTVRHEQMAGAYAGFDVLVLPSRTTPTWAEQFGRVLVEGLACGVPFVASASGEIPWVLEETGGGIVVPEGDAAALRAAVIRIRDSPGLRGELAGRGRQRVRERFSVAAVARELDRALRTAIAQHDSARPLSSA
jgi:glycosyltransferase involved in cell wall biosynthesis